MRNGLTMGTGMAIIIASMRKSDNVKPFWNATVWTHSVLDDGLHQAERWCPQANRKVRKNAIIHILMMPIMLAVRIAKLLDLSTTKIRRKKNTKLSLMAPNCMTCIT